MKLTNRFLISIVTLFSLVFTTQGIHYIENSMAPHGETVIYEQFDIHNEKSLKKINDLFRSQIDRCVNKNSNNKKSKHKKLSDNEQSLPNSVRRILKISTNKNKARQKNKCVFTLYDIYNLCGYRLETRGRGNNNNYVMDCDVPMDFTNADCLDLVSDSRFLDLHVQSSPFNYKKIPKDEQLVLDFIEKYQRYNEKNSMNSVVDNRLKALEDNKPIFIHLNKKITNVEREQKKIKNSQYLFSDAIQRLNGKVFDLKSANESNSETLVALDERICYQNVSILEAKNIASNLSINLETNLSYIFNYIDEVNQTMRNSDFLTIRFKQILLLVALLLPTVHFLAYVIGHMRRSKQGASYRHDSRKY